MSIENELDKYLAELQAEVVKYNEKIKSLSYDEICARSNRDKLSVITERKDTLKSVIKRLNQILDN